MMSCGCLSGFGPVSGSGPSGTVWWAGLEIPRTEVVTSPTDLPLTTAYVRERILRVFNGSLEDQYIEHCIAAATVQAERYTQRALMPQTLRMVLSGFPSSYILLSSPPLIAINAITYLDGSGTEQTLSNSPADYYVVNSGRSAQAQVYPLSTGWPSTISQANAVIVEYQAGYLTPDLIPTEITIGIALMVGELYKQRSMSIHAAGNVQPAVLQPERFWPRVWG